MYTGAYSEIQLVMTKSENNQNCLPRAKWLKWGMLNDFQGNRLNISEQKKPGIKKYILYGFIHINFIFFLFSFISFKYFLKTFYCCAGQGAW
jgi:hypothetical protein